MPRLRLRRSKRQLLSLRVWRTRLVFWSGAILVGITATALAFGSDYAGLLFEHVRQMYPFLPLLITPAGLVLIIYLTRHLFPGAQGSGIPQAIAALKMREDARRSAVLSVRIAVGKGFMILLGLLCGASIGREGPTVHIAASISYALTRFARFPHYDVGRGLILAGSAAGLAAAFNTPLAGIVFAIEEMARNFEEQASGTVFTAVIIAGMTALALHGNYHYFGSVSTQMEPAHAIGAVLLCGVTGGLLGGLFSMLLVRGGRRLAPVRERHPYLIALVCGLTVASIGILTGGLTFGTGYDEAYRLLSGGEPGGPLAPMLKLTATLVSYLSGIPGGIFAPSLSVGAGLGGELAPWFPAVPAAAITLLGMVAYFTGVVQTPITAVVIVMEMTDEHSLLLPLMATALVADVISRYLSPQPIYRALATEFLRSTGGKETKPLHRPH